MGHVGSRLELPALAPAYHANPAPGIIGLNLRQRGANIGGVDLLTDMRPNLVDRHRRVRRKQHRLHRADEVVGRVHADGRR